VCTRSPAGRRATDPASRSVTALAAGSHGHMASSCNYNRVMIWSSPAVGA
jgi:hypothetical protein